MKSKRDKLLLFLFVFTLSCEVENKRIPSDMLEKYKNNSFKKYEKVYSICLDSLSKWKADSILISKELVIFLNEVDSVFIFNQDSSRLFTTINSSSSNHRDAISDAIGEFGGAKIDNKWYFFFLATMVVPREFYKDDIYEPLTFEELSAISHKEITHNYIIKNDDGTFSPNESAFERTFFNNWSCGARVCENRAEIDSMIVLDSRTKYQHKLDKQEILQIKEEMANSKRPEEKKKWWEFW